MPKRAVFERSRREFFIAVSVGVHILLVEEQSSLKSQSRRCAKTWILTVCVISAANIGVKANVKKRGIHATYTRHI